MSVHVTLVEVGVFNAFEFFSWFIMSCACCKNNYILLLRKLKLVENSHIAAPLSISLDQGSWLAHVSIDGTAHASRNYSDPFLKRLQGEW